MVSCIGSVSAASEIEPLASPTLISYAAYLDAGNESGELRISFQVTAAGIASSLGVSYIEIHKASNDELVDTIYGSISNGLKRSSAFTHAYTYSYPDATPRVQYYAIIVVFAKVGTTYDSRALITPTVTAP